jgi:excisionase family DNA binding protein
MSRAQQLRLVDEVAPPPAPDRSVSPQQAAGAARPDRRSLSDFGDVLTVEEAAEVLRISRASAYEAARVWRATRRDGLPVIRLGRRLLVPKAALAALLATTETTVADPAHSADDDERRPAPGQV